MVENSFSATGISKSFGALKVLENVSITIKSGEMVGLLGPNGAGKTTFINIVAGYEHQDSGSVSLDGNSLDGMAPHDREPVLVYLELFNLEDFFQICQYRKILHLVLLGWVPRPKSQMSAPTLF
ncbi:MAG: ATP-binding cassette domain-containing protein [Actinobacteria bacterium]|nr:ATP-binding cassette domain-containing protein [Actinomycetota bacterium]